MYRVFGYGTLRIEPREVVKESTHQITFYDIDWRTGKKLHKPRREFKADNWFHTEHEAAAEIISRAERNVEHAKAGYERALRAAEEYRTDLAHLLLKETEE
jgi:hypothetical protein